MVSGPKLGAVVVGGFHKGSGKTTVCLSIISALRARGLIVQPFTLSTAVSDALAMTEAAGRDAVLLDGYVLEDAQLVATFLRCCDGVDVAVIDGTPDLFEGFDPHSERGSTAHVARTLGTPVVLAAARWSRTQAMAAKGFLDNGQVQLSGIVLSSPALDEEAEARRMHAASGTALPLLGILRPAHPTSPGRPAPPAPLASTPQRTASAASSNATEPVPAYRLVSATRNAPLPVPPAALASGGLEADLLLGVAATSSVPEYPADAPVPLRPQAPQKRARVAVAAGAAFGAPCGENLRLLEAAGADLVPFWPASGDGLPRGATAVYFGAGDLESVASLAVVSRLGRRSLAGVAALARAGGVVYAEGTGLLALTRGVEEAESGGVYRMAGLFGFRGRVSQRHRSGYADVTVQEGCALLPAGKRARGLVSHHASLVSESVVGGEGSDEDSDVGDAEDAGAEGVQANGGGARGGQGSAFSRADVTWRHGFAAVIGAGTSKARNVEEGFSRGRVLGTFVQLSFSSCPALAGVIVAEAASVDAAAVTAAVARAEAAVPVTATPSPSVAGGPRTLSGGSQLSAMTPAGSIATAFSGPTSPVGPHAPTARPRRPLDLPESLATPDQTDPATLRHGMAEVLAAEERRRSSTMPHVSAGEEGAPSQAVPSLRGNVSSELPRHTETLTDSRTRSTSLGPRGTRGTRDSFPPLHAPDFAVTAVPPATPVRDPSPELATSPVLSPRASPVPPEGRPVRHSGGHWRFGSMDATHPPQYGANPNAAWVTQGSRFVPSAAHLASQQGAAAAGRRQEGRRSHHVRAHSNAEWGGPSGMQRSGLSSANQSSAHLSRSMAHRASGADAGRVNASPKISNADSATADAGSPFTWQRAGLSFIRKSFPDLRAAETQGQRSARPSGTTNPPATAPSQGDPRPPSPGQAREPSPPPYAHGRPSGGSHWHPPSHPHGPSTVPASPLPSCPRGTGLASLCPTATDIVFALGAGDALTGVSDRCVQPRETHHPRAIVCRFGSGPHATHAAAHHLGAPSSTTSSNYEAGTHISAGTARSGPGSLAGTDTVVTSPPRAGSLRRAAEGSAMTASVAGHGPDDAPELADASVESAAEVVEWADVAWLATSLPEVLLLPDLSRSPWLKFALQDAGLLAPSPGAGAAGISQAGRWPSGATDLTVSSAASASIAEGDGAPQRPKVVEVKIHSLPSILEAILDVGDAVGAAQAASALVESLQRRLRKAAMDAFKATEGSLGRPHRVLLLESVQPLVPGSLWRSDVLEMAGGADVAATAGATRAAATWDDVRRWAPEVLIVALPGGAPPEEALQGLSELAALPGWWKVPAVFHGRVFVLSGRAADLVNLPGPRLLEGVELLTQLVNRGQMTRRGRREKKGGAVHKLLLASGGRCRPKNLPNYFMKIYS
ncbi:unnamed protein product [Pedinophyceae sp. YPF-701]|nr:unnamed protein product [Pedinophyceae sp. YPF-701]